MRGDDLQTRDFARPHNILQPAMIEFPTCRGFLLVENSSSQKEYSWWRVVANVGGWLNYYTDDRWCFWWQGGEIRSAAAAADDSIKKGFKSMVWRPLWAVRQVMRQLSLGVASGAKSGQKYKEQTTKIQSQIQNKSLRIPTVHLVLVSQ